MGEAHGVKFVRDQCYVFIRARLVSLSHGEHEPGIGRRGGGERGLRAQAEPKRIEANAPAHPHTCCVVVVNAGEATKQG